MPALAIAYFLTTFMFSSLSAHTVAFVSTFLDAGASLGAHPQILTAFLAYFGALGGCMVNIEQTPFSSPPRGFSYYMMLYWTNLLLDKLLNRKCCDVLCTWLCIKVKVVYRWDQNGRLLLDCVLHHRVRLVETSRLAMMIQYYTSFPYSLFLLFIPITFYTVPLLDSNKLTGPFDHEHQRSSTFQTPHWSPFWLDLRLSFSSFPSPLPPFINALTPSRSTSSTLQGKYSFYHYLIIPSTSILISSEAGALHDFP